MTPNSWSGMEDFSEYLDDEDVFNAFSLLVIVAVVLIVTVVGVVTAQ